MHIQYITLGSCCLLLSDTVMSHESYFLFLLQPSPSLLDASILIGLLHSTNCNLSKKFCYILETHQTISVISKVFSLHKLYSFKFEQTFFLDGLSFDPKLDEVEGVPYFQVL